MTDKTAARRFCRSVRDGISAGERLEFDGRMTVLLLNSPIYKNSRSILTYVSVGSEPSTREIIKSALNDGKTVAVPNCVGGEMRFYTLDGLDSLFPGKFGIPTVDTADKTPFCDFSNALCLVPALGLDRSGARLGYGGGYYDRFLTAGGIKALALCRERCIFDALPTEEHDIKIPIALTERRFIYFL